MMQRQYRAEGRGFIKQIMKQKKESFYKQFFSIYILLVLQNVITLSVNLTDNVMLGSYRETALAGAAAVNQIQFIFSTVFSWTGRWSSNYLQSILGSKRSKKYEEIFSDCHVQCNLSRFFIVCIYQHCS